MTYPALQLQEKVPTTLLQVCSQVCHFVYNFFYVSWHRIFDICGSAATGKTPSCVVAGVLTGVRSYFVIFSYIPWHPCGSLLSVTYPALQLQVKLPTTLLQMCSQVFNALSSHSSISE